MPHQPLSYTSEIPEPRSNNVQDVADEILQKLTYSIGKDPIVARRHDWLRATVLAIRDRVIDRWMDSTRETWNNNDKRVYYLSLEFLIGRLMRDAVSNLGLMETVRDALKTFGVDMEALIDLEPDAALGNGGLGRLAACFMESMSSVEVPAYGYGIRYVHGMFRQEVNGGWQIELPEDWLAHGNEWEFERRESAYPIGFGGHVESEELSDGSIKFDWHPAEHLSAVAFDTPVVGWRAARVNTLRLWSAQAIDPILLERFNQGDHVGALEESARAETLTKVLYPADETEAGQELRLRQEFFFSSASLQDILRRHIQQYETLDNLPDKVAVQLNDSHPAICVAELMRLLVDEHGYEWEQAWELTVGTIAYTNHTLLPEAIESWPVTMLERLLPRHMQIIYRINAELLADARARLKVKDDKLSAISLIDERGGRRVRMGWLAFVGSHSVNGVSKLHGDLMKETVFKPLHELFPDRVNSKTNGITPRRWLMQCNPALTEAIGKRIGDGFVDDFDQLAKLRDHANDPDFQKQFMAIKRANKESLAALIKERVGLTVSPDAMFDVQIKRIHEYKRQLLNIIETVAMYDALRAHPERDWVPRVKIFAGKAAPSYWNAKLIIKLINDVARVVNHDPAVRGLLKVVFLPNYNVSLAERIVPAADLSEQISTAGMEASGTGNMKLALNGALTIGTLDGANVEMRDLIGPENIEIFGLTAEEVNEVRDAGKSPSEAIAKSRDLRDALDAIQNGAFSPDDVSRYNDLIAGLRDHDWFMVARDFQAYQKAQRHVDEIWKDQSEWARMAIMNTASMGWFSSDRTILEYAHEIWGAKSNDD